MRPRTQLASLGMVAAVAMLTVPSIATGDPGRGHPSPSWVPDEPAAVEAVHRATLLTGDRVVAELRADGSFNVSIDPARRTASDPTFVTTRVDDDVYVIPSDAAPLIEETLDRELFNVSKLAAYDDPDGIPVIITYDDLPSARTLRSTDEVAEPAFLNSIDAVSATLTSDFWENATADSGDEVRLRSAGAWDGIERVWLDEQIEVALTGSVPQIGAPGGWDLGFDGTGRTVAVLDTGIDAEHPDLAGKVVAARDFTGSGSSADRFGHGTHVAGIVAGTGDAPGGYTGVAPGADLINAKVLNDAGSGTASGLIAGMEWAAQQGADVVNMSIGTSGPSRGTDPIIQAVNSLTEAHDLLFVISAGNLGPGDQTIASPGAADAALTVGAVNAGEQLANFSSRGPRYGDFAIKPEITAPGVGIVSAASGDMVTPPGGTELVGDHHLRASGTSMAAPHVAGVAALLLQQDPDLAADALKARLATTAVPNGAYDVYQQGGGRVDVVAALTAPVAASPAVLDLGHWPYPHDDAQPASTNVTYTNTSDQPVTVDLALDVRGRNGATPGAGMVSVEPSVLSLEPGEAGAATVTLDISAGDVGLYGGYLVASGDGEVVARIPVGFQKEAERYELRIVGIDRDGRPATGYSSVGVLDVEDMTRLMMPSIGFGGSDVVLRVPPGTYSVLGGILTYDQRGEEILSSTFVGDAEVEVFADTTVVLDARDADRITMDTPEPEAVPIGSVSFGYWRTPETWPGPLLGMTWTAAHTGREYYAAAMDPVTLGGFEFHSRWRLAAPEALLDVTEPVELTLDPVLLRAPAVDGDHVVPLVDVGAGTPEDYAGLDVAGAAVLARRGPEFSFFEQEEQAAAAGAAALIVTNDVPGKLTGPLSEAGTIPTLSLTADEGDALRGLLDDGDVTVRLRGTSWSPYLYDLVLIEDDGIRDDLHYVVERDQLAALEVEYRNDTPGHEMAEARHFVRPFHSGSTFLHPYIEGPRQRTEYVIAGDGIGYIQSVFGELPFEAELRQPHVAFYEPGSTVHKAWFDQPARPALLPEIEPTTRTGDTLNLRIFEWVDASRNHVPSQVYGMVPYGGDTIRTRVWQDDQLLGELDGFPRGSFPMTSDRAEYRVELDVTRKADWWRRSTRTSTTWTFGSERPGGGTEVLPLLSIDYDAELDVANTELPSRDRRGRPGFEIGVYHQDGGLPAVSGARVWVSYDDGDTWRGRSVRALGDGRFEVSLPGSAPAGSEAVSVRVEAWDRDGNRIEQEIIRAWHLP